MENSNRPVNLELATIHFPVTAVVSILHRITGVTLFLCIILFVFWLHLSLRSEQGFESALYWANHPLGRFVLWGAATTVSYHFLAGMRHLVMDFGGWETLPAARRSAQVLIGLAGVAALGWGALLW